MADPTKKPFSWSKDDSEAYRIVLGRLASCVPQAKAQAALRWALKQLSLTPKTFGWDRGREVVERLRSRMRMLGDQTQAELALRQLHEVVERGSPEELVEEIVLIVRSEGDLMHARRVAHEMVQRMGMGEASAVRVATVVSELSRIIIANASTGELRLSPVKSPRKALQVVATEREYGDSAGNGRAQERGKRDLALGLLVTQRLMDEMTIEATEVGTRVTALKYL